MELEKPLTLGAAVGKLTQGTGSIQGFKEDRRNVAKVGKSLYYGPFTTHAPAYDTTFATVNAEEANLLLSAYGSEPAANYALSLRRFCADSEYCLNVADEVLDALTGGAHSDLKYVVNMGEDGLTKVERVPKNAGANVADAKSARDAGTASVDKPKWDFESLRSLNAEGIDVSFLDEIGAFSLNSTA
jgi:bromodomain-containing protein 7/9